MCFNFLYNFRLQRVILRKIQRETVTNVHMSSRKVPCMLVRFLRNLKFLGRLSKNIHIQNFMKMCPVKSELIHEDGRPDRHDEANTRFSQFCERPTAPKKGNLQLPLKHILKIKRLASPISSEGAMSTASMDNSLYGSYKNS